MSIATEITRIQNAKGSIKETINSLGATIQDSDTIDSYAAALNALPVHNTSDATVAANRLPAGDTAYGPSGKVTGTVTTQGATTITPSSTAQVISAPRFLTGDITISAVSSTPAEGETKFYQCVSSSNGTWAGFEMIKDAEGCYSISSTMVSSLTYTSITPESGGVYDEDATLKIDYYKTKIIISGSPTAISGTIGTAIENYTFMGTGSYVTASDGKSDQITATSSNLPSGLSISNGSIVGTPTVVDSGNITLTLTRIGAISQTLVIPYAFEAQAVTDTIVVTDETINATTNSAMTEVQLSSVVMRNTSSGSTDVTSSYVLSYTLKDGSSLPDGISMTSAGVISGTPTTIGSGSFIVIVSATGEQNVESKELLVTYNIDTGAPSAIPDMVITNASDSTIDGEYYAI